jgi:hypothetical protein
MRHLALTLLFALSGMAADVESLLPELQGKAPARTRNAAAWQALHRDVLAYYLPKFSVEKIQDRSGPAKDYQFICWRAARPGAEVERQAASRAIAAKLDTEIPQAARLWLVKILQHIGRGEAVPALAKLADAPEADARTWALRALVENPSTAADEALADLLANAPADRLVERLDAAPALPSLVPLLAKHAAGEATVAKEAMEALGRNGSPAAIVALSDLKPQPELAFARDVALLACADRVARTADKAVAAAVYRQLFAENQAETIRCGALRGLLAGDAVHAVGMVSPVLGKESPRLQGVAADYLRESADEATVMAFARALPSMSVSGQVLLLDVFAARGATAVRFAVLRALNSREEPVRIAAVQALASLGDTGCVRTLLTLAAKQDALGQEAADALQRLGALGVDDALLAEAKKGTPERRVQCVDLLVARRARVAVPAFLAYAKADDKALVASACKGLGQLAGTDDLPALVGLLTSLDADTSRRAVAKATLAVAKRCPDEAERTAALLAALPNAPEKAQLEIIGALGELGGAEAFAAVGQRLASRTPALREAALRALGAWPSAEPADALLAMAKTETDPLRQVLALRGCVRALGLPGAPAPTKVVEKLGEAMAAAKRDDERKVVLAGLGRVRHADALAALRPYLNQPALKAEAVAATLQVAVAVSRENRALAEQYLALGVQHADAGPLREQAAATRQKIEEFDGFLVTWLVAGPFFKTREKCAVIDMKLGPEGKDAATVKWQISPQTGDPAEDWQVPFEKVFGGSNRVAYATTWICCETPLEARFEIGSDDGVKVWLDDQVVHRNDAARPVKRGEDVANVSLPQGWHRITMKVTQGGGHWGGCLRLRAAAGGHLDNWRTLADFHDLSTLKADLEKPAMAASARRALADIQSYLPSSK